jgi:Arc/MetJ-type ribon-helix-helix transcriptional regulator
MRWLVQTSAGYIWVQRRAFSQRSSRVDPGAPMLQFGSTLRATVLAMARSLHVRLDDSSTAALRVVRGESGSDSEAVRTALREAAARRRARSSLIVEVERLAADDGDREEMRIVREQLAELAPDPVD